jgi:hypothetical protein
MPIDGTEPRLAPGSRRVLRLVMGAMLAALLGFGAGWPFAYLPLLLTISLLVPSVPPPGLRQTLLLVVIMLLTSGFGLLLGPVLTYVPLAGVLAMLLAIAAATIVAAKPGRTIIGTLIILGGTVVAVIARQSSAAAVIIVQALVVGMIIAVVIAQIAHAALPDTAAPEPPAALAPDPLAVRQAAIRSVIIMAPPIILALSNPQAWLMLLMKGALLSQQVETTATRQMARELVGSTALGGALALAVWLVLSIWPTLLMLVLLIGLAVLVAARPLYSVVATSRRPDFWQNVLVTMPLLLGPALTDNPGGDGVLKAMLIRLAGFIALALYAAVMTATLSAWQHRRAAQNVATMPTVGPLNR